MGVNGVPGPEERGEPLSWKCVYLLCGSPPVFDVASRAIFGKQKGAILSPVFKKVLQGCLTAGEFRKLLPMLLRNHILL